MCIVYYKTAIIITVKCTCTMSSSVWLRTMYCFVLKWDKNNFLNSDNYYIGFLHQKCASNFSREIVKHQVACAFLVLNFKINKTVYLPKSLIFEYLSTNFPDLFSFELLFGNSAEIVTVWNIIGVSLQIYKM